MPVRLSKPSGELVFVYGTYRKSASNCGRMKGATWISRGLVRGRLLKVGWFPVLVLDPQAETVVRGDVFRADGSQLEAFHDFEGLADEANKENCRLVEAVVAHSTSPGTNWKVKLWEWTGPEADAELIPSGDWLDVERPRTTPLMTWVVCACAAGMPIAFAAAYFQRISRDLAMFLLWMGLLSPFAGYAAIFAAARRRERQVGLLAVVAILLVFEIVVAVLLFLVLADRV